MPKGKKKMPPFAKGAKDMPAMGAKAKKKGRKAPDDMAFLKSKKMPA